MSSSHSIPATLDAASKFFYWDADVGMAGGLGLFSGVVLLDSMVAGVVLGAALGWGWSKIKSGRHPAFHWHLLYWQTPWSMRRTPPSYLREMVG